MNKIAKSKIKVQNYFELGKKRGYFSLGELTRRTYLMNLFGEFIIYF